MFVPVTADQAPDATQFELIVSEKGGPERRETYRGAEITIGRVQGNDLVLPKGNVSKRHARILFREGRFIVTDLNSTNGTYVNRRRIAQATILREEDSLYVGDFVIRVVGSGVGNSSRGEDGPESSVSRQLVPATQSLAPEPEGLNSQGSAPALPSAPAWDRMSAAEQLSRSSGPPAPHSSSGSHSNPPANSNPPAHSNPPHSSTPPALERLISEPPQDSSQRFSDMALGHRRSVSELVDTALTELGEPPLKPDDSYRKLVRQTVERIADQLLVGGHIPIGTSAEAVSDQACEEILDLGPLAELLGDPAVQLIAAARYDSLSGTRDGRQQVFLAGFSQMRTFELAIKRLVQQASEPIADDAEVIECSLAGGTRISIVRGTVSPSGPLLTIRKPRKVTSSLDDLVRRGAVSRAMATFLVQCVSGQLNLLVVGPQDDGAQVVLASLCAAVARDKIVAITDVDDLMVAQENSVRLDLSHYQGDVRRLLEMAGSLPNSRLAVTLSSIELTAALIEATGSCVSGLLASLHSANLSRGLLRLPADIAAARPGMSMEAAIGWVLSSFDVVIEVTRLRDGRVRVLRIGELVPDGKVGLAVNDIFRFVVSRVAAGGAVEGIFSPSGTVPRVAGQLEALGMRIDPALFNRTPTR
jgi:pilus assembly protein CpaF